MTAIEEREQAQLTSLDCYRDYLQTWFGIILDWEIGTWEGLDLDFIRLFLTKPPLTTSSILLFIQDRTGRLNGQRDYQWGDKAINRVQELINSLSFQEHSPPMTEAQVRQLLKERFP